MQDIADAVGCHKSIISRELKRGTVTQKKTGGKLFEAYFPDNRSTDRATVFAESFTGTVPRFGGNLYTPTRIASKLYDFIESLSNSRFDFTFESEESF